MPVAAAWATAMGPQKNLNEGFLIAFMNKALLMSLESLARCLRNGGLAGLFSSCAGASVAPLAAMKILFCEYQFVVRGNPQGVVLAVVFDIEALALTH
jgi:hypothetical protein